MVLLKVLLFRSFLFFGFDVLRSISSRRSYLSFLDYLFAILFIGLWLQLALGL